MRASWGAAAAFVALSTAVAGSLYMLVVHMPGTSYRGEPPPLSAEGAALRGRLEAHVRALAERIGERNVWTPGSLAATADYIGSAFRAAGHATYRQPVIARGEVYHNVEVRIPGRERRDVLVIGAHYDTVAGSPGADDNASGVAVLLELARLLQGRSLARGVHLVAFVNEEAPFFATDAMGSLAYARAARAQGLDIAAMISLEMLGYYDTRAASQRYPAFLGALYPERGDFVAFVTRFEFRRLVRAAVGAFRDHATVPSEGLAAPELLEDIRRSDHWAFWSEGVAALMLTDTAEFRNPNYHRGSDTPDTLDYETLARVTLGLAAMIEDLAARAP